MKEVHQSVEGNRMCFEVDVDSIDIKKLLQKDFLELSMRVISDANPNVNKSWFTPESMEDALPTFVNKPILGYFENGDFVSHNGEWGYDTETQMNYWDTLGKQGERILGVIREKDGVQIVEGDDGLKWIELTCCLWVQYCYKQVKRLLKDAKKAKENGGPAKNVSVEVDILESEKLPNGVLKINKFNLIGITILGSRNGVKVEPGIENAGLSVIDIMGKDVFEAQEKAIRLAYERIDSSNNNKEDISKMENENNAVEEIQATQETSTEDVNQVEQFSSDENNLTDNSETTTQEPEKETATFEEENTEDGEEDKTEKKPCEKCGNDPCTCAAEHNDCEGESEQFAEAGAEGGPDVSESNTVIYDLTYLLRSMNSFALDISYTADYYKRAYPDQAAVIAVLERLKNQHAEDIAVIGNLIADATEEFKQALLRFESSVAGDTVSSLYKKFEAEVAKNAEYSAKIAENEKLAFLKEAKEIIDIAELSEQDSKSLYEACENGELADVDSLKNKIALKLFEEKIAANKNKAITQEDSIQAETEVATFSAPVEVPAMTTVETKTKKKTSCWDNLEEYNGKKN